MCVRAAGISIRHIFRPLRAASSSSWHQETVLSLVASLARTQPALPNVLYHHEGGWTLGQLTTSSAFSRRFSWCFQCTPLAIRDACFFAVRDWLLPVCLASDPASFSFLLVRFPLCSFSCHFSRFNPVKLPCYSGSFLHSTPI